MSEGDLHAALVWLMFGLAPVTAVALLFVTAPYGRYGRPGWGPTIPARLGWLVMESPAVLLFVAVFSVGAHAAEAAPLALLGLWQLHYLHRVLVYPLRIRGRGQRMPLTIAAMAFAFNLLNAYINARWLSEFGEYAADWLASPVFLIGAGIFLAGFAINIRSDSILFSLRRRGDNGYAIPQGGLFRFVSCPNYLGEIIAWFGWALAAWSLAGLAFACFVAANLAPRALAHHRWYRETFANYPADRRALIPLIF